MQNVVVTYLALVNLVAFASFGWDKYAAAKGKRRVPERQLLLYAFLLGAPGAWAGSRAFHHKTVKRSFRIKLIAVTVLEIAILVGGFWYARR